MCNLQNKLFYLYNTLFSGSESDNVENVVENKNSETSTKDDTSDKPNETSPEDKSIEPTECKIPKTEEKLIAEGATNAVNEAVDNVDIKIIYNKKKYDVSPPSNLLISEFKKQLQGLLGKIF